MYVNIVKHKVRQAIKHDAYAYTKQVAVWCHSSEVNQQNAGNCKYHGKYIVPLNFSSIPDMVIPVKKPHETMHYVFMRKPGHKLHKEEG
jgi:hypothetical protein